MKSKIKEQIKINQEDVIKTICELVKIPSVRDLDSKEEGAPFGKDIAKALDKALEIAKNLGMRTYRSKEGYYGYIEVGDESLKEMVGIIGHLDVVPPGDKEQWIQNSPFLGEVIDGKLYGRGSLDDKGPVVMALFGIKNLMDLGFEFKKRVRIILGTSEETTWEGITEYIKKEEKPTIAFSPDANFPLINAEKTIVQIDALIDEEVDFEVESLGAYNAVADAASYRGNKAQELKKELDKLGYEYEQKDDLIIVKGKSAHAMMPEKGINAIGHLAQALYNIDQTSKVIEFIAKNVKNTYHAELIVGEVEDKISGKLKFNIGRLEIKNNKSSIGIDSRIPVLVDSKDIIQKYKESLEKYDIKMEIKKTQEKLYVEEDSFLVSTLMRVYKEVTGELDAKPLSSGGGTYARAFDNCVAFGCVFTSQGQIDNMHQPNECLEIKFLLPALEIYTNAIYELSK